MQTSQIQEQIRNGDFRSAMDGIKFLANELAGLQGVIENIANDLKGKINLVSQLDENASTVTELGNGFVSVLSETMLDLGGTPVQAITGTNTLFTTQIVPGYQIQIGNISSIVHSIVNDTLLYIIGETLIVPIYPLLTNEIFSITIPNTSDQLTGNFNFGAPLVSGLTDTFHGIIGQNSTLKHKGTMNQNEDVITVGYAKKLVAPSNALGLRSIKRDYDLVVGADLTFDPTSEVQYKGNVSNPYDILNVKTMQDYVNGLSNNLYACWYAKLGVGSSGSDLVNLPCTTDVGMYSSWVSSSNFITKRGWAAKPPNSLSTTYPDVVSDNFYGTNGITALFEFVPGTGGYKYIGNSPINLLVKIGVSRGGGSGDSSYLLSSIMVDNTIIDYVWAYSTVQADPYVCCESLVTLVKGQTILIGCFSGTNAVGFTQMGIFIKSV